MTHTVGFAILVIVLTYLYFKIFGDSKKIVEEVPVVTATPTEEPVKAVPVPEVRPWLSVGVWEYVWFRGTRHVLDPPWNP